MLIGLDGFRIVLLWWTLPAFVTMITGALLVSGSLLLWGARREWHPARIIDSMLLAVALGLILARAEHVLVNWTHFSRTPDEILSLSSGGLGAHGAILGAVMGGYIASRWFDLPLGPWLGAGSFALPLISFAAWWGCAAHACAYGSEVVNLADYPSWLVWEATGDYLMVAPRYATQPLGMLASVIVLLLTGVAAIRLAEGRRLGVALLSVMATSFALGFLRGDAAAKLGGLRLDQWFDLVMMIAGVVLAFWPHRPAVRSA